MFDRVCSGVDATDASVIDAVAHFARLEARAAAARYAAIADLVTLRTHNEGDRQWWACDGWDVANAEIGAALGIGRQAASGQMAIAVALRDRLPKLAQVFAAGDVSASTVSMICWRTRLVESSDTLALLDAALTGALTEWAGLSQNKVQQAIDGWVQKFDPAAVLKVRASARTRGVGVGKPDDETGAASIWGALLATDAEMLDLVLSELARQVCDDDPRTVGQRRADALGVLAARGDRLACQCGVPQCPASGADARASAVVIHVLTDALPTPVADPLLSGEPAAPLTPASPPKPAPAAVGYVVGGPVVPPALLADLVARGATVHPVASATDVAGVPRYRPSKAIDEFVRMRAMTCMFPGCGQPAVSCDVDHTIPWPSGPTHPGNLNPKCRKHHLLKTFYGGPDGWRDRQLRDGSIVWTAPTGHSYTSVPGSRILFPDKIIDTPLPSTPPAAPDLDAPQKPHRGIMMPIRRRTRAQDRAQRVAYERALNEADLQARARKAMRATRQHPPADNDIPPPF